MTLPNESAASGGKKTRGRAKSAGRYETRAELCDMVWRLYRDTKAKVSDIARITRASEGVVHKIIEGKEGMPPIDSGT